LILQNDHGSPDLGRSHAQSNPIEWPRKAGDVDTLAGQLLEAGFIWKRLV
jgi:hypothetical protein